MSSLEIGPDEQLYGVGFQGSGAFRLDPAAPESTREILETPGQAESIGSLGDSVYFGTYPDAELKRQHVDEPWGPETLFDLENLGQDRPKTVVGHEGKVYMGTVPARGEYGGGFAIYDPETGEHEAWRGLSPNQSITAVAVHDGYAYLGTSVSNGRSTETRTEAGKLLVFDLETREIGESVVPLPEEVILGSLTVGPGGDVWGISVGELFVYDTETREVRATKTLYDDVEPRGGPEGSDSSWGAVATIELARDGGSLYGTNGTYLYEVAVEEASENTFEPGAVSTLYEGTDNNETVLEPVQDEFGDVWFLGSTAKRYLLRYSPPEEEEPVATIRPSTTEATVGQRVTFSVADTSGDDRWIDSLDWAFGDDTTGTGWWNAHRYAESGSYTVTLTATDDTGHSTTDEVTVTVG